MDLAEDENFVFKHPYFFKNYTFKFEGLKPEVKANFENIVKSMGAIISDESQYVFTDISNTSLDQKEKYYSLSYFSNSILATEPLKIDDYKFSNLVEDSNQSRFCCMNARYILKNKTCMSYFNQHICKLCIEKTGLLKESNSLSSNQDNGETKNANIHNSKSIEIINDSPVVQHEISSLNLNENSDNSQIGGGNHNTSTQSLTDIAIENEVNKDKSDLSDLENTTKNKQSDVSHDEPSCSTQDLNKPKTNKPISIGRWKRVRTVSSNSDASSKTSEITNPTRERENKRLRLSSSPPDKTTSNRSSSTETASDEEQIFTERLNTNISRRKWWMHLPTPTSANPNYTDPETKARGRGRDFSYEEKRLMIAYLVINDKIDDGTSRRPWRDMLRDGYLQDRTSESLNNHYRKVLLPNIESFRLPKDIEKNFIKNRNLHLNRSHK